MKLRLAFSPRYYSIEVVSMLNRLFLFIALVSVFISGCAPQDQPTSEEQNVALVKQFYEEFDAELSLDVVDRWLTPEYVNHMAGSPDPLDLAAYRELLTTFFTGFSEIQHEIKEIVAEDDRIAMYVDISMKHTGEFQGLEPTRRTVYVSQMLILRWETGKIAEEWIVFDFATFMQQLQVEEA